MKITEIEIIENNVKSAPDSLIADGERTARDVKDIFDKLPELIAQKHNSLVEYAQTQLCTKTELETAVIQEVAEIGGAKIARLIYDNDNDGMVDNAKHLDGCNVDYFATAGQGVHLYTQSSGTLSGSGENGKFKATATGTYIAFTIGGVSYAVKAGGETEIELTSGVWYSFILDTDAKTINFKSGGGLSNSKLALATATAADVLTGKTFYSGNKTLKTGTLNIKCMAMVTSAQGSASVYLCDGTTMKKGDTVSNNYCAFEYKDYNTYSLKSKIAGTYIIGGRNVNNSNIMPFTIKTVNANEYVFQNYAGNSSSGTQFIFAALVG